MADNSKFRRGSGVYTCHCCGHRTRETGNDESLLGLCAYCYEEGGFENELADGHITADEFDEAIAKLKVRYNR